MTKIAIIIPSRLDAKRLPNKPLKMINNKEMILHVYDVAVKANVGEVYVATPDKKIFDIVKNYGGNAIITNKQHQTGTDRVFQVFKEKLDSNIDIIINLQGDMPNIETSAIQILVENIKKKKCDIGTLASNLNITKEEKDPNVVKLIAEKNLEEGEASKVIDFLRLSKKPLKTNSYHHIGIYGFTNKALIRYVSLKRSKLELERKLEQLRALENRMRIDAIYINSNPLSVDTENDLKKIKNIMK